MTSDSGLTTAVLYNPRQLNRETLKAIFTARRGLLERIIHDLRAKRPTHQLIVGPRGMGKTTLLRRIGIAIEEDAKLAKRLLPLTFPEEQYNVGSLGDFYLNCLDALADYLDKHNDAPGAQKLDTLIQELRKHPEEELVEEAESALVRQAKSMKRQYVLLVDNLSIIIGRLADREKWRLREWLSRSEERPVLVAATVKFIADTADYGQALYEFLHVQELTGCDSKEAEVLLRELARVFDKRKVVAWLEEDPAKLAVLNRLAGGSPRTLVMLFQLLVQGMDGPIFQELERLLDMATPLYKARFEELPQQAQRVVDLLAIHWDPATRQQLESESRMEGNAISSQLSRLAKLGVVEEVVIPGDAKTAYQIAERFFNIWYLMRASRRSRHQLRWLVEFLKAFYSASEREKLAHAMLHSECSEPLSHGQRLLAMSQAVDGKELERELRNTALYTIAKVSLKQRSELDLSEFDRDWLDTLKRLEAVSEKEKFILKAIEANNGSAFHYVQLGDLYRTESQQFLKAEEAYSKALKLDPAYDMGWTSLGQLLTENQKRHPEAERAFRNAIRLDKSNGWAWIYLGELLDQNLARSSEAENAFRKAAEVDKKNECAWISLGEFLERYPNRLSEAEQVYRKAIETAENSEWGWLRLGHLLADRLGRSKEASKAYRKAVKINSKNVWAWIALGDMYRKQPIHHAKAEKSYRNAGKVNPSVAVPWLRLGSLLSRELGRPAEAEQAYRRAIQVEPTKPGPKEWLAWFLFIQRKEPVEAETLARRASELNSNPSAAHTLACVLAWQGKCIESMQWIRSYLESLSPELQGWELYLVQRYFREMVIHKQAGLAVQLLEETDRGQAWRPLLEALRAARDEDRVALKRINPEQREAAESIYDFLMKDPAKG